MARTFLISLREDDGRLIVVASEDGDGIPHLSPSGGTPVEVPASAEAMQGIEARLRSLELHGQPWKRFRLPAMVAAEMGEDLAQALPETVREALAAALHRRPVTRLDVVLDLGEQPRWLHGVPWELLRLPGDDLAVALQPKVALYRRAPGDGAAPERGGLPLRILHAVAAPDPQAADVRSALDWETEEEIIAAVVRDALPGAVFETADEGSPEYLAAVASWLRPHVLHLSGHGRRGELLLEDELGFERPVNLADFGKFLLDLPDSTRLVILSQCLSAALRLPGAQGREQEGEDDSGIRDAFAHFTATAARLRGYGVGMLLSVADDAAAWWAAGFYAALADGRYADLPHAVAAGRRRVYEESEKRRKQAPNVAELDRSDWAAPVLYVALKPRMPRQVAGGVFRLLDERRDEQAWLPPPPPMLTEIDARRDRGAFVGRRRERRRLLRAVRDGTVGIVLRALGGTGKSTLAAHLLERLAASAGWGAIYFAGRLTVSAVATRIAERLADNPGRPREVPTAQRRAIREQARALRRAVDEDVEVDELSDGLCDLIELVRDSGRRLVLVFDDFEANQLDDPSVLPEDPSRPGLADSGLAALLGRLADRAARLAESRMLLLFTCRFPVPVPAASAEKRWLDVPVGPLGAGEQRKLLGRLAPEGDPEAAWKRLGGHPRALEILGLVAARQAQDAEKEQEMARRLGEDLTARSRAAAGDALAVSAELASEDARVGLLLERLRPVERAVLEGLARFRQPFTRSACPAVLLAVAEEGGSDAVALWQRLGVFGLVAPARFDARLLGGEEGPGLWQVPQLVRGELSGLDASRPAIDAAAARHLYMRLTTEQPDSYGLLQLAESVVEHGIDGYEWKPIAVVAGGVLGLLNHNGEWRRTRELGETWLQRAGEPGGPAWKMLFRAVVSIQLATAQRVLGEPETARQLLESAGDRLRQLGDSMENELASAFVAKLYHELGILHTNQGRYAEARQYLHHSVEIKEKLGNLQGHGASLSALADLESKQGRYDEARQLLRKALDILKVLKDSWDYASYLHQLAGLDARQGRYDEARQHLRQSLEIKETLGDRHGYAASLHELAILDSEQGRYAEARQHLRESLSILNNLDNRRGFAASLHELAKLETNQGRYEEARQHLRESLDISEKLGDWHGYATSLHELARVEFQQGLYEETRQHLNKSLEIREKLGDRHGYAVSLHQLASLEAATGHPDEAARNWQVSIRIAEKVGDRVGAARSRVQLGQILQTRKPAEAVLLIEAGAEILQAIDARDAGLAQEILQNAVKVIRRELDPALEKADNDVDRSGILYLRGLCRRLSGCRNEALADLRTSLELNLRLANPVAVWAVRAELRRLGEPVELSFDDEAGEILDMAERVAGEDPAKAVDLLMTWRPSAPREAADIAELEARLNRVGEKVARAASPGFRPQVDLALGEFLSELGRTAAALEHLRRALRGFEARKGGIGVWYARLAVARHMEPSQGVREAVLTALEAEIAYRMPIFQQAVEVAGDLLRPEMEKSPAVLWLTAMRQHDQVPPELLNAEDAANDDDRRLLADAAARLIASGHAAELAPTFRRTSVGLPRRRWTGMMKKAEEILTS